MNEANLSRLKAVAMGAALIGGLIGVVGNANAGASIVINNINAPGVGFNDPTPATPVGGNPGTTLGEQRLYAFTYAADQWGATLTSTIPIVISAEMTPLSCTSTSATLGSAGATSVFRNFANAPKADTWYSYALANKLSGAYQGTLNAPQISANFNSNLGQTGCLDGQFFYLGVDNHAPSTSIDFVTVLLHEMGHGFGFQTYTDGSTGRFNAGFPSIWDWYLTDTTTGLAWKDETNAQRKASAISGTRLVWAGPIVTAAVPDVLTQGLPKLTVTGMNAGSAKGRYTVGTASFGPAISTTAVVGQIMPVVDQPDGMTGLACDPLTGANQVAVAGNVALIDRGTCAFTIKVKNAQNAGAIAVIIADNAAGSPPAGLGGSDPTITIPSVRVTQTDGATLKAAVQGHTARRSGVSGSLALVGTQYQGADPKGRMMLYAPNPYQSGSSVSHYDTSAFRNQLMEPAINADLTHSVIPPQDMTFPLLQDIGW